MLTDVMLYTAKAHRVIKFFGQGFCVTLLSSRIKANEQRTMYCINSYLFLITLQLHAGYGFQLVISESSAKSRCEPPRHSLK